MKTKLAVFAVALLSVCLLVRPAMAIGISIDLGDRLYYTDGGSYWDEGYLWVWRPGHREHHHWVHGEYVRSGEFHHEHREHHRHHRDHDHDHH